MCFTKRELHEKRASIPRTWVRGGRVERDAILPIRIGLMQSNLHNGEELLMDVFVVFPVLLIIALRGERHPIWIKLRNTIF
jgi:hypothetical protein